jgi:divalent metal cation (Fe/Co/Zn/Cd) transporter
LDNTTKIAIGSIVIGTSVLGLKTAAWWITGSVALLSDALESIVNVATAFAALIAIRVAARPADANHPYGPHKAEYFSAGLEGLLIIGASILILHEAYGGFMAPAPLDAPIEGLFLNGVATAINAFWAWVLISRGRKLRSPALHADGKHLLTDVNILWSGSKVVKASLSGLMDEAVPADVLDVVQQVIATQANGALEAHDILTRQAGQITFIDFHLVVPGQMTVFDAHEICDRVEAALRRAMPGAKVNIHLEPEHKSKDTGIPVHDSAT